TIANYLITCHAGIITARDPGQVYLSCALCRRRAQDWSARRCRVLLSGDGNRRGGGHVARAVGRRERVRRILARSHDFRSQAAHITEAVVDRESGGSIDAPG